MEQLRSESTQPIACVCVCGSTKFIAEMAIVLWELEKQGHIALGCHLLPSNYGSPLMPHHQAEADGVKELLDMLHLRKIEMATLVRVMNIDSYVGESTRAEILHAESLQKPVAYHAWPTDVPERIWVGAGQERGKEINSCLYQRAKGARVRLCRYLGYSINSKPLMYLAVTTVDCATDAQPTADKYVEIEPTKFENVLRGNWTPLLPQQLETCNFTMGVDDILPWFVLK